MSIKAIAALTLQKIKSRLRFDPSTVAFIVAPIMWLLIFVFLRQAKLYMDMPLGRVEYVSFLISGVLLWRMLWIFNSEIQGIIRREKKTLSAILTTSGSENLLLSAGILSAWFIAAFEAIIIFLISVLGLGFVFSTQHLLFVLVLIFLIILAHTGISLLILAATQIKRWVRSFNYIFLLLFVLLSGVFYPAELFPPPLNTWAYAIPLTQGLHVIRQLLFFPTAPIPWHLVGALLAAASLLFGLGIIAFKRSIRTIF